MLRKHRAGSSDGRRPKPSAQSEGSIINRKRWLPLAAISCTAASFACLSAADAADAAHSLEIANRVSKFQTFYAEAMVKPLDAEARWALWKKDYDIAAVPPGPDGDAMARRLLDGAWANYPTLIPKLPALQKEAETP